MIAFFQGRTYKTHKTVNIIDKHQSSDKWGSILFAASINNEVGDIYQIHLDGKDYYNIKIGEKIDVYELKNKKGKIQEYILKKYYDI